TRIQERRAFADRARYAAVERRGKLAAALREPAVGVIAVRVAVAVVVGTIVALGFELAAGVYWDLGPAVRGEAVRLWITAATREAAQCQQADHQPEPSAYSWCHTD